MANWQWFGRLHTRVYRATGGILGGKLASLPMLLLTSTGRKSGEPRTTPLPYLTDEGRWVIVGAWWQNWGFWGLGCG